MRTDWLEEMILEEGGLYDLEDYDPELQQILDRLEREMDEWEEGIDN
jgi:hypothetical protein